jgi:hypothetical protein
MSTSAPTGFEYVDIGICAADTPPNRFPFNRRETRNCESSDYAVAIEK